MVEGVPLIGDERVFYPRGDGVHIEVGTLQESVFDASRIVEGNDYGSLRHGRYSEGFVAPPLGKLAVFASYAWATKRTYEAATVIDTLRTDQLGSRTMALLTRDGLFVDDDPDISLFSDLGAYAHNLQARVRTGRRSEGVTYGNRVQFTPKGFAVGVLPRHELVQNSGFIALVGGVREAELYLGAGRTMSVLDRHTLDPAFGEGDTPRLVFPVIHPLGSIASYSPKHRLSSFGMRE